MKKTILRTTFITLLFSSNYSVATPYNSMDPRSLGMGGIGVAAGNGSQAHYYNPALLASAPKNEDFNFEIDVAARGADPENLVDAINTFGKEKYLTKFTLDSVSLIKAIEDATQNAITTDEITDIIAKRDKLVISSNNLLNGIHTVTNKSITFNVTAGASASNPESDYGWTLFYNAYAPLAAQGNLDKSDDNLMINLIDVLGVQLNKQDIADTTTKVVTLLTELETEKKFKSSLSVYGALIQEVGFSYSSHTELSNYDFDYGITPKLLNIEAFDRTVVLDQLENEKALRKSNTTETYNKFNLDLGIAKNISENWKTGLAIRNLFSQRFNTPNGETVKLNPAARIGVSYRNNWVNVGADLDLTENSSSAGFDKTRFAAIGAEIDVWLLQLRAGYRMNLANDVSYPAIGLGLYLFGLNIDAAVAGTIPEKKTGDELIDIISGLDDINASLRVGISW